MDERYRAKLLRADTLKSFSFDDVMLFSKTKISKKLLSDTRKRNHLRIAVVIVLFLGISFLHMGPSALHPSSVVLGNTGDHTAGIMYSSWVQPNSPILGHSVMTNYPSGESLQLPLALSAAIPATTHLVLSRLFNIVTAWNLLVLIGYMSSAMSMYLFMRWVTRNTVASIFSAYAVTFTPYHAFASHGQIAGLLNAVLILIVWQFFVFWVSPTWKNSLLLAGLFGLSFYTDGYFILFGLVTLLSFWLALLVYGLIVAKKELAQVKRRLVPMILVSLMTMVSLAPLLWVKTRYAEQISSYLGNARGDIVFDAQTYSADLIAYVKPSGLIFLGYSVLLLALLGVWFIWRDRKNISPKSNTLLQTQLFFGTTLLILSFLSIWFSLKPTAVIGGLVIHNPSDLIIKLTPTWRVFGRLYAVASIGLAGLAGLGLSKLLKLYPTKKAIIIAASFGILIIELWSYPASFTPSFNYTKAPPVYGWLNNNSAIKAIAEYPLDEPPQGKYLSDYYTFQEISNKPLLNTFLPNSPQSGLRRSLAGINDPQTIPVLRALGIGLVNIRPQDPLNHKPDIRKVAGSNVNLKKVFSYTGDEHWVDSFLILPGKVAKHALTIPRLQYFQVSINPEGTATYAVGDDTVLSVIKVGQKENSSGPVDVAFKINADAAYAANITQGGDSIWSGTINEQTQDIILTVDPAKPIIIANQKYDRLTRMFITDLRVIE
ncbi:MAG: hypothetical protein ABIQ89_02405 [Candidatus Saccharimonadales bacterium]